VDAETGREEFEFEVEELELDLVSRRIVTGPSLHSETFIIAANFPSTSIHQNTDKKRSVGIDQDRLTSNSTCGNATQTQRDKARLTLDLLRLISLPQTSQEIVVHRFRRRTWHGLMKVCFDRSFRIAIL
jgi:hypothetical protein